MKKSFRRMVAIFMATATMVVSIGSLSVGAISYKGTTTALTSGGSGGKATIRSRVYTDYYSPYGGVNVYYFGVVSDISTSTTLKTKFNVSGSLIRPGFSTPISASGTANSVKAYSASSNSKSYTFCTSKTTTTSSAYGTSSQECNYPF